MQSRFLSFLSLGMALTCAGGQTSASVEHIPISNGLWHLHKIGIDQNKTRKWDNDDEFRLCVGDGGAYVPFLIGRLGPGSPIYQDAEIRVHLTNKTTEYAEVIAKNLHDDLSMELTVKSPVKLAGEGTENTSEGTWSVHMDLDYEGADCQGIWPEHSRAKVFGQWR